MTGELPKTAVYLTEQEAEQFKEFCRQYEAYTLIQKYVLDTKAGSVNILVDEAGVIRKIQTSRTFLITF